MEKVTLPKNLLPEIEDSVLKYVTEVQKHYKNAKELFGIFLESYRKFDPDLMQSYKSLGQQMRFAAKRAGVELPEFFYKEAPE